MERTTPLGALTVCDLVACTLLVEHWKAFVGGLMKGRSTSNLKSTAPQGDKSL